MSRQRTDSSRRRFIKKSAAGLAGAAVLPSVLSANQPSPSPEAGKKRKMIYRFLGKTGLKLPIVSMGVMNADNPKLVRAALDEGIIHLDTAHVYQRGRNEEMVGKVVKEVPRDSFVVATKVVGNASDRKTGLYTKDTDPNVFVKDFETSLKRLGLEYVDILYLHSVKNRQATLFEPLMNALIKLKKQGKTKFIGVSTHRNEAEVLRAAADSKVYDVVLTAYNFKMKNLDEMHKALDYAAKAGLGIIAMKTQAGVYWDKERQHPINMKAALKWALQNPNIHTSIPGFINFDQMNLDLSVMEDLTLTAQEKADLKLDKKLGLNGLYCQQCGKCLTQCENAGDIPSMMRCYMYAYGYKSPSLARETLDSIELPTAPCRDCTACSVNCTSGFDIKEKILDITRLKTVPKEFLV